MALKLLLFIFHEYLNGEWRPKNFYDNWKQPYEIIHMDFFLFFSLLFSFRSFLLFWHSHCWNFTIISVSSFEYLQGFVFLHSNLIFQSTIQGSTPSSAQPEVSNIHTDTHAHINKGVLLNIYSHTHKHTHTYIYIYNIIYIYIDR